MERIRLDRDLTPVTEFRANAAALIERVRKTRRPIVLTQHGRGAIVLVDVQEYEKMIDALERALGATRSTSSPERDPVEAYKEAIDRSLLRENLSRPVAERLRRLAELARFAEALRGAARRQAAPQPESPESTAGSEPR